MELAQATYYKGFEPLGNRVLIRPMKEQTTTGGIIIPESVKNNTKSLRGEVIATGRGLWMSAQDGFVPMDCRVGDKILYSEFSTYEVLIEGEPLILMREEEILGIYGRTE